MDDAARTGRSSRRAPRHRRSRCAIARDERGAVSAELVIATPLLLLLIMGVIQFALWQHAEHIAWSAHSSRTNVRNPDELSNHHQDGLNLR